MTALSDLELRRARWRRALDLHAVDTTKRTDFATGGLAGHLRNGVTALLVLLPDDPEAAVLNFDDELRQWLESNSKQQIADQFVPLGDLVCPTANALALVTAYNGRYGPWDNYTGIHRSGAVEMSLGNHGGTVRESDAGASRRIFFLSSIVAKTWALLKLNAALHTHASVSGPWQLTVALHDTADATLGALGSGWAQPGHPDNSVAGCREDHLLWHIPIGETIEDSTPETVAYTVGDRLEDAWGAMQRRYLDRAGSREGQVTWQHR